MKIDFDPAKSEQNARLRARLLTGRVILIGRQLSTMRITAWITRKPESSPWDFWECGYMSSASRPLTVVCGLSVFAGKQKDIMKMNPLTDKSGEVRELTREDVKRFRPAAEVLPQALLAVLPKRKPGQRGPRRRRRRNPSQFVTAVMSWNIFVLQDPAGRRASMRH